MTKLLNKVSSPAVLDDEIYMDSEHVKFLRGLALDLRSMRRIGSRNEDNLSWRKTSICSRCEFR